MRKKKKNIDCNKREITSLVGEIGLKEAKEAVERIETRYPSNFNVFIRVQADNFFVE